MPNAFHLATVPYFACGTVFFLNIAVHCILFFSLIMAMTNAERQKKYCEKLKEKHSSEDLRNKESDSQMKKQ